MEFDLAACLEALAALPSWLSAALDADRVGDALAKWVPEFALTGSLRLRSCKLRRLVLREGVGRWEGTYTVTAERDGDEHQAALLGALAPPDARGGGLRPGRRRPPRRPPPSRSPPTGGASNSPSLAWSSAPSRRRPRWRCCPS
jgi:hypothetical protein